MFTKAKFQAFALLLLTPFMAQAGNLPTPAIANSPGLTIHFTRGNTADLDMMAAAGVKVVRTDFKWATIEYQKGVYDWSAYDELINNLVQRGMRPYMILDFSNALYEQVHILSLNGIPYAAYIDSPNSADSVAAFAAWAKAAALRYQSKNVIWEIWNEPNIATFWKPGPNVADYTTLSQATCNAIHGAVPGAAVVGGATSGMDWNFLYAYLGSGVLDCLDGISVHPYRYTTPETVSAEVQYLQWVISQYVSNSQAGTIPVISGEWGYPTQTNSFPLSAQASYAVRMQLNNLLNNIPISIWYDWKNDGIDATDKEQNFGIVTASLSPKPSYTALKTLSQQLTGYKLVSRVAIGTSQDYILTFINAAGKYKVVAWTSDTSNHLVTLLNGFSASAVIPVTSISGVTSNVKIGWAGMSLSLSSDPQYLDLVNIPIPAP